MRSGDARALGRVLGRKRIGSFVFVEHEYGGRAERGTHSHDWLHLSIVQSGRYARTIGGRSRSYRPGSVSFIPTNEAHGDAYGPGSRCLHLAVPFEMELSLIADFKREDASRGEFTPGAGAATAVALCREFRNSDTDSALVVEALLLDLASRELALRVERSAHRPPWIQTVLTYLDDSFEQPWTLAEIAKEVGVHPVHMCRSFSQSLDCTLGEYIRTLRVIRGWQLLSLGRATIAEVATQSGFADQSHFTRLFARRYGVTPARYRRSARHADFDEDSTVKPVQ